MQYQFFTGKGGVGKTSLACATAVQAADEGKKVLLISTDPASNLSDVLGCDVTEKLSPVKGLANLHTINIDPEVSARAYRDRVISPLKGKMPEAEVKKIEEGLSGACTTEIASFDEFSRFITGEGTAEQYDLVIFDTAPTGHTLRLLELPAAWSEFIDANPAGASCLGPASALQGGETRYRSVVETLRDPALTTFFIVSRPDGPALKEAARTSAELSALGMHNQQLLINGVFRATGAGDALAARMEELGKQQLDSIPVVLQALPQAVFPLMPYNILGLEKLRSVFSEPLQQKIAREEIAKAKEQQPRLPGLRELVNEISDGKNAGLIMTMGKGGVGKTIAASAIAVMLARKGHEVLLTTTDPAAHISDFTGQLTEIPATLSIERIDPRVETQRYMDKVFEEKSRGLDEEGKKLLREDLRSPCTEEVAVFHAFSKAIQQAKRKFVVIDTAPTGHTLLLLDTTGSYHREILRHSTLDKSKIRTPFMYLQDKEFAKILLISLPETTPMREAAALQDDLARAGIHPYAWVVNQSLSALPHLSDPVLHHRAVAEGKIIRNIREHLAERCFGIPYLPEEKLLPAVLEFFQDAAPVKA